MTDASPDAGNIELELDGQKVTLRPTLEACITISRLHGGANAAIERCMRMDWDTIRAVIVAGIGRNAKELDQLIFKTGVFALSAPCIDFITIVNNGGRPPIEEQEGAEDGAEDPPAG